MKKNILPEPINLPIAVYRLGQVSEITSLPPTSISDKHKAGSRHYDPSFPEPIQLTPKTLGWYQHEIVGWVLQRPRVNVGAIA